MVVSAIGSGHGGIIIVFKDGILYASLTMRNVDSEFTTTNVARERIFLDINRLRQFFCDCKTSIPWQKIIYRWRVNKEII